MPPSFIIEQLIQTTRIAEPMLLKYLRRDFEIISISEDEWFNVLTTRFIAYSESF